MGRTAGELTPDEAERYRQAWRNRQAARDAALRKRTEEALAVARVAAHILKDEFHARRVWLFGSLARGTFGWASDIDLAVEGLAEREFFRAVGRLLSLHSEITVDLVDIGEARPAIRRSIETEGVPL